MADVIEQILSWPLDGAVIGGPRDSYDYFEYDTLEVSSPTYVKGEGITDFDNPASSGGHWRDVPTGYTQEIKYFEINFTAEAGISNKWLEITSIEFLASSFVPDLPVRNFFLAYSSNSDFSNSIVIYDFPEADIENFTILIPASFFYPFRVPIILEAGKTIYFRLYPYNANANPFTQMYLLANTFFINAVVRNTSTVSSIPSITFVKDCSPSNSLTWQM